MSASTRGLIPPALPHVYRVTKYDPADRNRHGHYTGTEDVVSDHGPVEAAYLEAVAAFARDTGVDRVAVREPGVGGFVHFGAEPTVEGHGLAGLFPADLTGFHDGAEVSIPVAQELVRAMLRDNGAWCRLEVEGAFAVHIGYDQYMYVGSRHPCGTALDRTRSLGLFPEPIDASPYDFEPDGPDGPEIPRPADEDFWARVRLVVADSRETVLEEGHLSNATRWHRLTDANLDAVRAGLAPRARLAVWPDLFTDIATLLDSLPDEFAAEFVWEDAAGRIEYAFVDETELDELTSRLAGARAGAFLSPDIGGRRPLLAAVLPDADGVLRARWQSDRTPVDGARIRD
ncbi:RNA-binding protein [Streptomyces sp. NPDC096339]|uniref:RNA-binding protein n=1 Tax=Streptomyces sp. NPDC096339 TaxID=3366086 RepID=UPI00381C7CE6